MVVFYSQLVDNKGNNPCGTSYASFDRDLKTVTGVVNRWKKRLKYNYDLIKIHNLTILQVYACNPRNYYNEDRQLLKEIPIKDLLQ